MPSTDQPIVEPSPAVPPPPSKTYIVSYGYLRHIGEFAYDGEGRLGCGARVVIRTRRGTELAQVLSTTCSAQNCAVSVDREQIASYIAASGGRDFPFCTEGRIVRIADSEDLTEQTRLDGLKPRYIAECRQLIAETELPMKLVEVELLLGGEMATFYFLSEDRVDFRALVKQLAQRFHTRIQMHQVGSRDEARLVADFETCGQHCCCRQFLKVLRPVNMSSAKMQKATLDPNKISGRCGRLKCCLRYEEDTYEELRRRLPRPGSRVRVEDGVGTVEETIILTQLVKIRLDEMRFVAVANEEILERDLPENAMSARPRQPADEDSPDDRPRGRSPRPRPSQEPEQRPREQEDEPGRPPRDAPPQQPRLQRSPRQQGPPQQQKPTPQRPRPQPEPRPAEPVDDGTASQQQQPSGGMGTMGKRRRRRRGRGRGGPGPRTDAPGPAPEAM